MKSNKSIWFMQLLLLYAIVNVFNVSYCDSPVTIYTPRGSTVPDVYTRDEFSQATIDQINADFDSIYVNATRLADASRRYNCHGYAWHVSEGAAYAWIGYYTETAEDVYWTDGSYDIVSESIAKKVSYSGNHSAITTSTPNVYISKWGTYPLALHNKNYVPQSYGSPIQYYLRSVDVPQDQSSITSALNAAVSGQSVVVSSGNYTVFSTSTIKSGVTLQINPGATMNFSSGTSLVNNGILTAVGTSSSIITFTKSSSGNWGGIQFNSSSSGTLDYCNITFATTGINMYNSSPTIKHSTIDNNSGVGVYCDYYSSPVMVGNNIRNNSSHGLRCNSYSSPNLTDNGYPGSNVIKDNSYWGINATYNCNPNLNGYGTLGNSVFNNATCDVAASYQCTVNAQRVYWGWPVNYYKFCAGESSTIDWSNPLETNPNPYRNMQPSDNNYKTPMFSIMSSQNDNLNLAEEKQKEGKYDESINLFLEVFKKEKENSKGRYALIKIEECFTQARKKDFLDFSKKELKPLLKEENELFVVLLELETHQLYNQGYAHEAMNNLKTILNKYNMNAEIEKQTLYRIGAFYLDLFNDIANAEKTFDDLAAKYPEDELLTYANLMLNEDRYNTPQSKKVDEQIVQSEKTEELSNHPNPFNPTTKITFALPSKDVVRLKVYDILGREVAVLANRVFEVGKHEIEFNASRLPSGVYFYNLTTSSNSITKKMLFLK